MYHLSAVVSVSDYFVKTVRTLRLKSAACILTSACASIVLFMPLGAHAQPQNSANTSVEQIQVENQVDINKADAETLALALDGVGMTKAKDIVAYREQNGDFKTVDDLQNVRGIGKATLERNRSRILVVTTEE